MVLTLVLIVGIDDVDAIDLQYGVAAHEIRGNGL